MVEATGKVETDWEKHALPVLAALGFATGSPLALAAGIAVKAWGALQRDSSTAELLEIEISAIMSEQAPRYGTIVTPPNDKFVVKWGRKAARKLGRKQAWDYSACSAAIASYFVGRRDAERPDFAKKFRPSLALVAKTPTLGGGKLVEPEASDGANGSDPTDSTSGEPESDPEAAVTDLLAVPYEQLLPGFAFIVFHESLENRGEVLLADDPDEGQPDPIELENWSLAVATQIMLSIHGQREFERIANLLDVNQRHAESTRLRRELEVQTSAVTNMVEATRTSSRILTRIQTAVVLVAAILVAGGLLDIAGVDALDDAVRWVGDRIAD